MTIEVTIEDSTVDVTIDDSTIEVVVENNEVSVNVTAGGAALTLEEIAAYIHAGSEVTTDPTQWTGSHQFEYLIGGLHSDAEITFATVGAGVSAVSVSGGMALSAFRRVADSDFSSSTESKISGSQCVSSIVGLLGVPTVGVASPFEALDAVIHYDPARGSGLPLTWPECRNLDLDSLIQSGAMDNSFGATSRLRVSAGATVNNHTGFLAVGFNGNTTTDSDGDIGDYIGFHSGSDPRITSAINGSMTNHMGFRADMPTTDFNVTNDPEAFWCNGDFDSFQEEIPFGIIFGSSKEDKIYHSATFGQASRLTIEASAVEFKDNGQTGEFVQSPGTTSPVPVLERLPEGSVGAVTMKWVKVSLGSAVYFLPMLSRN